MEPMPDMLVSAVELGIGIFVEVDAMAIAVDVVVMSIAKYVRW